MKIKKSWKTSVGGAITSASMALMYAVPDWMTPGEQHWCRLVGFVLGVAGPLLLGLAARDSDRSDQDMGLRPEVKPPPAESSGKPST